MMVGVSPSAAKALAERTGYLPQLAKNTTQVAKNFAYSVGQNNGLMRDNVALLVSVGQATIRSFMANADALKAHSNHDPQADFKQRQAGEITCMEWGGFLLQFGVLKTIGTLLGFTLTSAYGVKMDTPESTGPLKALNHLGQSLLNPEKTWQEKISKATPETLHDVMAFKGYSTFEAPASFANNDFKHNLLRNIANLSNEGKAITDPLEKAAHGFKSLHRWGPMAVGTVLGVWSAGWVLMRISINEKQRQALLDKILKPKDEKASAPSGASTSKPNSIEASASQGSGTSAPPKTSGYNPDPVSTLAVSPLNNGLRGASMASSYPYGYAPPVPFSPASIPTPVSGSPTKTATSTSLSGNSFSSYPATDVPAGASAAWLYKMNPTTSPNSAPPTVMA
jgi:hypothetical protein